MAFSMRAAAQQAEIGPYLVSRHGKQVSEKQQLAATRSELAGLYRELYEAAQMQRRMSGPRTLRRGEFEIAAEMFPVGYLSGDFFNLSEQGESTLLAIGDIAGKGLKAGMWFTYLLELTRSCAESFADPAEALWTINRRLCEASARPPLTSLYLARLNWTTGELIYSNAGHPAALLLRADNRCESLTTGGPVLGAVDGARFESAAVEISFGEMLLAYTDGLLECVNDRQEEFGAERVIEELRRSMSGTTTQALGVGELLFSIVGAAQDFAGSRAREDDCTVMAIRRSGRATRAFQVSASLQAR